MVASLIMTSVGKMSVALTTLQGQIGDLEVRDDFIDEDRSQTRTTRRFQVVEQDEDLSD